MTLDRILRDMASRGMSRAEAARELGLRWHQVDDLARDYGVEFVRGSRNQRLHTDEEMRQMAEWRAKGIGWPEIAKRIGASDPQLLGVRFRKWRMRRYGPRREKRPSRICIATLRELAAADLTAQEIAPRLHCHPGWVRELARRNGIALRRTWGGRPCKLKP